MNPKEKHTQIIKAEAARLGFSFCGIAKAGFLEEEAKPLEQWLQKNMHGEMRYMQENFDKRLDPRLLVDGAKSVVSLLLNYFPEETQNSASVYKISKYAYGKDYHKVIKKKLKEFLNTLEEQIGEINGRAFVDSAPVLDKAWAKKSGLGWMGKNGNLITKAHGSYFFIAELIIDLELDYDAPVKDYCGNCTRCIDACPTNAIVHPQIVDGSKCISYFTIELKNAIPDNYKDQLDHWIFGCDVCQDVCPWNRFAQPGKEPGFKPLNGLLNMQAKDWEDITEEIFIKQFEGSAIKRTGWNGLIRNIAAHKKQ